MTNKQADQSGPLQKLELVFALSDHRALRPSREPVITNFRPDYFSPQERAQLYSKQEKVETGLGVYHKKYDYPIFSREIGQFIDGAREDMVPSLAARVVIYHRE